MVGNSKTFGNSTSSPESSHWKTRTPGDEGEFSVPDLTLTANFKMAAKETTRFTHRSDKVSNLYSVVKMLTDVRTPCVIFNFMRPSKFRPLGSQMIKRELDVGVFEPFD